MASHDSWSARAVDRSVQKARPRPSGPQRAPQRVRAIDSFLSGLEARRAGRSAVATAPDEVTANMADPPTALKFNSAPGPPVALAMGSGGRRGRETPRPVVGLESGGQPTVISALKRSLERISSAPWRASCFVW